MILKKRTNKRYTLCYGIGTLKRMKPQEYLEEWAFLKATMEPDTVPISGLKQLKAL